MSSRDTNASSTHVPFVSLELLNDDYIFANNIRLSSNTKDGFSYTVSGVQNVKGDTIDADVAAKLNIKGATLTGKLFTGGEDPSTELKYETKDSKGRKVTLCGTAGKKLATSTAEVLTGPFGIKLGVDVANSDLYASGALAVSPDKCTGFVVAGAESVYNLTEKKITMTNYAVSFFDGKESECAVHVLNQGKKAMISYSHHVRPGFSVATQMTYARDTKATSLAMGSAYRMDGATTIKAKLDSEGGLALSYIQDVRPNTTLIMSSKFNTMSFDSAKVGISLTME